MDFRFTDDQRGLGETVRDYLAGEHGPETLRRLDAGTGRDPAIWQGLIAMGLGGVLVPEAEGGLGMGLIEGAIDAVELGRANVSEPIADTALVAAPLLDAGQRQSIAAGELKVALADPVNPWVADLDMADLLLAGDRPQAPPADPVPLDSIDPLRRLFAGIDGPSHPALLDRAALITAAQLIGGTEQMLALATDYAKTREQFGQPIGAFQAIKHHLATVAVRLEFARPVLWRAAHALQQDAARAPVHVSHAKVAATDAAMLAAETAIQVHGAMGYTYEVDLHFWMKRAWALAGAWGDRAFHLRRVAAATIDGGMSIGPETTFASERNHG